MPDICTALSAERDREALLFRILDAVIDLPACDGGTLYLPEEDGLHFCRTATRSGTLGHYSAGFTLCAYTHATPEMTRAEDTIGDVIGKAI